MGNLAAHDTQTNGHPAVCESGSNGLSESWISEALIQLLGRASYDSISVSQICTRAGVGRQTFYRYFKSKDDALRHELSAHLERSAALMRAKFVETRSMRAAEEASFAYWQENPVGEMLIRHRDVASIFSELMADARASVEVEFELPTELEGAHMSAFRHAGITAVYRSWMQQGMQESPSHMAAIVEAIYASPIALPHTFANGIN